MPLRYQGTKKHKVMNISFIILVNPLCPGVLVAEKGLSEYAQHYF